MGLPKAIIKSHPEEKWSWLWARELPKILEFPFNISATTEDGDFKISRHVGFAKAHHKIPPRRKRWGGPVLAELQKNWDFPFNICVMAIVSTSNFVDSLGGQLGPS